MIGFLEENIRRLRRVFSPSRWVIKLLDLPTASEMDSRAGLVMIQIDGLSRKRFQHAMAKGHLPFLKHLLEQEQFREWPFYSGIPSSTPAVQGELFYGVRQSVSAFKFRDHETGKVFTMYNPSAAALMEERLRDEGEGLLKEGSSYSNIFSGGAKESHFCVSTTRWATLKKALHPYRMAVMVLCHLHIVIRMFFLVLTEMFLAVLYFFHGILKGRSIFEEFRVIAMRLVFSIFLREYITAGVGVDIARGLPVIHVNYLGYDEQAHLRGPSSRLAYWSLHGIDRCIRRIWHATHHSLRRDYDVWVYSDHGQEEVVPYPVERQTTIQKAVEKLFHDLMADKEFETEDHAGPHIGWPEWLTGKFDHNADEAAVPGGKPPTVSKNRLIVAARGPVGHIYLPCLLSREQTELFASQLVADVKIPVVLALGDEGEVHAWTEEGRFRLPEDGDRILGKEHPYLKEVSQELADLCHHADKGAFLILGWRKGKKSITFPTEWGSHAGPGPEETSGFALLPSDAPASPASGEFLRALDLRKAALTFLGRLRKTVPDRKPFKKSSDQLRVISYNVHRCRGMDGRTSPERIARVIARYDPDVIALQEVSTDFLPSEHLKQAEKIAELLDMEFHFHVVHRVERREQGNAILSRFPLRVIQASRLPGLAFRSFFEPRGALWVELDLGGHKVQMMNVHLSLWPHERRMQAVALMGKEWLSSEECRPPLILCGDLNSLPGSPVYRHLTQTLRDAQYIANNRKHFNTWFGRYPLGCIDYIFVGPHIHIHGVKVPNTRLEKNASDHLPLVADLEIRP